MVTIEEALRIIENQEISLKSESKPLEKALGYALATNTTAPFDVPEFDNSAMDGYALCGLYQEYRLVGEVAAGDSKEVSLQDGEAVRIFTGAKVPQNTTAVMMQEKTSVKDSTLFLDEIGDMSEPMQKKLLRVLQEGEVRPVGGKTVVRVDVRIISATNKDLQKEMEAGRFREDLFYRLHILPLTLPPLRERLDDLDILVQHFLEKLRARTRHEVKKVHDDVVKIFRHYPWPGNIRELENVMEQALVFAEEEELTTLDLPHHITQNDTPPKTIDTDLFGALGMRSLPQILDDIEKQLILKAYERSNKVKAETARVLGIKTSALYYKLEKYDIS